VTAIGQNANTIANNVHCNGANYYSEFMIL
jgi:hypothetical protein